jgi:hypothetical protein
MKFAYEIIKNRPDCIYIRDLALEKGCMSITNAAEDVIEDLRQKGLLSAEKKVLYEDTMGEVDELKHDGTKFRGFAPGPNR